MTLHGWRRVWNVAMDNTLDLPGYKHYVDPDTGERPALFVTFVNIERDDESSVDGVTFEGDLAELDARERNYERTRVGDDLWAYVGTTEARARFARGVELGTAVVAEDYLRLVRASFPDVEPPDLPVRRLTRIELRC